MNKDEIYEMVIREMTELAILKRDEQNLEESDLKERLQDLSIQVKQKLAETSEDIREIVTEYMDMSALAADHDCLYLYTQGAKDCVELLKKLGVL